MEVNSEIRGLVQTRRDIENKAAAIHGRDVLNAFRKATLMLQHDIRENVPVDTGKLKNSIVTEVGLVGKDIQGVVGTVVIYAPYMESGTRPHTPPSSQLETWANRHGIPVGAVVSAIANNGTEPRNFFKNAFENRKSEIESLIEGAIVKASTDG